MTGDSRGFMLGSGDAVGSEGAGSLAITVGDGRGALAGVLVIPLSAGRGWAGS